MQCESTIKARPSFQLLFQHQFTNVLFTYCVYFLAKLVKVSKNTPYATYVYLLSLWKRDDPQNEAHNK